MATAAALYSQFSAVGTPASHYIGYQVFLGRLIEGLGPHVHMELVHQ